MKPFVSRRSMKQYPLDLDKIADCFVAIDFETDGRDSQNGRVIEIGACFFENGKPAKTFSSLVHSVETVSPFITELTGITSEMVQTAPPEKEVWEQFVRFLGGALEGKEIVVAHNAGFDTAFLKATLERLGYSATIRYLDTVDLSQKLLPHMSRHALNVVCEELAIELENHHRALDDAVACGHILARLMSDQAALKRHVKNVAQALSKRELEIVSAIVSMGEADWGVGKSGSSVVTVRAKGRPVCSFVCAGDSFSLLANADLLEQCPWTWTFANQKECEYGLFRLSLDEIGQLEYFKPYIQASIQKAMERPFEDESRRVEWMYGIEKQTYEKVRPRLREIVLTSSYTQKEAKPVPFAQKLKIEAAKPFNLADYERGLAYRFYLTKAIEARKRRRYTPAKTFLKKAYANGLRCAELFVEIANVYQHQKQAGKEVEWLLKGASFMDAIHFKKERQLLLLRAAKRLAKQP